MTFWCYILLTLCNACGTTSSLQNSREMPVVIISVKNPRAFECRAVPPLPDEDLGPTFQFCAGTACAHFRFIPFTTDPAWIAAVQKAKVELNDTSSNANKSVLHVNANRAKYGLPATPPTGYCGLAGKPEVL